MNKRSLPLLSFVAVFAFLIVYFLAQPELNIPDSLKNTAADPSTFMSRTEIKSIHEAATVHYIFAFATPIYGIFVLGLLYTYRVPGFFLTRLKDRVSRRWLQHSITLALVYLVYLLFQYPLELAKNLAYGDALSPLLWWRSWMREYGVVFLIGLPVLLAVWRLVLLGKKRWWLMLWLISLPFLLYNQFILPVAGDAMFHDLQPIQDNDLKQRFMQLAAPLHFSENRIYQMKVSDQTPALNAYITGIGGYSVIVLWDTDLHKLSRDELLSVMGHELGHYVHGDLYISLATAVVGSFVFFFILSLLWNHRLKKGAKRVSVNDLPLLMLWAALLLLLVNPFNSAIAKQMEVRADHFRSGLLANREADIRLFQKIAETNRNEINPPWLYQFFFDQHPSLEQRIAERL